MELLRVYLSLKRAVHFMPEDSCHTQVVCDVLIEFEEALTVVYGVEELMRLHSEAIAEEARNS